jgi:hypothetical protein
MDRPGCQATLSLYCQEVYRSPHEDLRVAEPIWRLAAKSRDPEELSACCAAHEEEWGLGFETDEDLVLQADDHSAGCVKTRFMARVPTDIEVILGARSGTHEISVQTEEAGVSPENWNYEAQRTDAATTRRVSFVVEPEVNHQLEVKISQGSEGPRPIVSGFSCKHCRKAFKNGQALGGHLSRCHPN